MILGRPIQPQMPGLGQYGIGNPNQPQQQPMIHPALLAQLAQMQGQQQMPGQIPAMPGMYGQPSLGMYSPDSLRSLR